MTSGCCLLFLDTYSAGGGFLRACRLEGYKSPLCTSVWYLAGKTAVWFLACSHSVQQLDLFFLWSKKTN